MARKIYTKVDDFMASLRADVHKSQMAFVQRRSENLRKQIKTKIARFFDGMMDVGFGLPEGQSPPQLGVQWAPYTPRYKRWKTKKGYYEKGSFRARGRLQASLKATNLGVNTFGNPKINHERRSNTRITVDIHVAPKAEGMSDYDLLSLLRTDQRIMKLGQRTGKQRPLFAPYFRWWFRTQIVPLIRNAYK